MDTDVFVWAAHRMKVAVGACIGSRRRGQETIGQMIVDGVHCEPYGVAANLPECHLYVRVITTLRAVRQARDLDGSSE